VHAKVIARKWIGADTASDPWVERQVAGRLTWASLALLILSVGLFSVQSAGWVSGGFVLPSGYSDLKIFVLVSSLLVAGFFLMTMAMLSLTLEVFKNQPS
jgi:hypothetical protein